MYLDEDLKTVIFRDKEGLDIKNECIKEILERNYQNPESMVYISMNLRSFYENTYIHSVKSIRDYLIEYYQLDIKVPNTISIHFTPDEIKHNKDIKSFIKHMRARREVIKELKLKECKI